MTSIIYRILKDLKSQLRVDSIYHIFLSIAIIIKIIFITCAITCHVEEKRDKETTNFFRKVVRIKDIANELTTILVCIIILIVLNPFNKTFCIDKHFKMLLFGFAVFTLIEVQWVVFSGEVVKESNLLQFFFGRVGTLNQQIERDLKHSEYYKTTGW